MVLFASVARQKQKRRQTRHTTQTKIISIPSLHVEKHILMIGMYPIHFDIRKDTHIQDNGNPIAIPRIRFFEHLHEVVLTADTLAKRMSVLGK